MAAKNARKAAAAKPAATETIRKPWDWADLNRQQVAAASEGAGALFRGFEAMRRIQEQAAHAVAERHAVAAGRLRESATPTDLAVLQAEVLREDLAFAARYWQDLADAALEMNAQIFNCATQMVDSEDLVAATPARFLHS